MFVRTDDYGLLELPAFCTVLLLLVLELLLWSVHFWPFGLSFSKVETALATWPPSCKFSQKVT